MRQHGETLLSKGAGCLFRERLPALTGHIDDEYTVQAPWIAAPARDVEGKQEHACRNPIRVARAALSAFAKICFTRNPSPKQRRIAICASRRESNGVAERVTRWAQPPRMIEQPPIRVRGEENRRPGARPLPGRASGRGCVRARLCFLQRHRPLQTGKTFPRLPRDEARHAPRVTRCVCGGPGSTGVGALAWRCKTPP